MYSIYVKDLDITFSKSEIVPIAKKIKWHSRYDLKLLFDLFYLQFGTECTEHYVSLNQYGGTTIGSAPFSDKFCGKFLAFVDDETISGVVTGTISFLTVFYPSRYSFLHSSYTLVCLINVLHALFNVGSASTLHDLIWPCTFIDFWTFFQSV